MFARLLACVLVLLGVAMPVANAETPSGTAATAARLTLAQEAVGLAHVRTSLVAWRKMLLQAGAQIDCGCNADDETKDRVAAAWRKAVASSFDEAAITGHMEAALAARLDRSTFERWNAFYRGPLGRKIHIAERPDLDDKPEQQATAELQAFRRQLDRSPERKALVQRIAAASDAAAASVDAILAMSLGTALGASAMLPAGMPRMDTPDILAAVEAQRPMLASAMVDAVTTAMAKMYAGLSAAELRTYLAELSAPHGQRVTRALRETFQNALRQQALAVGAAFARELTATRI